MATEQGPMDPKTAEEQLKSLFTRKLSPYVGDNWNYLSGPFIAKQRLLKDCTAIIIQSYGDPKNPDRLRITVQKPIPPSGSDFFRDIYPGILGQEDVNTVGWLCRLISNDRYSPPPFTTPEE